MDQLNSAAFQGRQVVESKALLGNFQGAMRNVHSKNLLERWLGQKHPQELSPAATEVQDPLRLVTLQNGDHRADTQVVQPYFFFDGRFFSRAVLAGGIRVGAFFVGQAGESLSDQAA